MLGNSLFQLSIKTNVLHYLPTVNDSQTTLVGYRSLHDFSKFKFDDDHVVFRQTSEIFMLYLFLGYFFVFGVFLITHSKQDIFDSSVFIRNVLKWTLFEDQTARVAVLRTELE